MVNRSNHRLEKQLFECWVSGKIVKIYSFVHLMMSYTRVYKKVSKEIASFRLNLLIELKSNMSCNRRHGMADSIGAFVTFTEFNGAFDLGFLSLDSTFNSATCNDGTNGICRLVIVTYANRKFCSNNFVNNEMEVGGSMNQIERHLCLLMELKLNCFVTEIYRYLIVDFAINTHHTLPTHKRMNFWPVFSSKIQNEIFKFSLSSRKQFGKLNCLFVFLIAT